MIPMCAGLRGGMMEAHSTGLSCANDVTDILHHMLSTVTFTRSFIR